MIGPEGQGQKGKDTLRTHNVRVFISVVSVHLSQLLYTVVISKSNG